MLKPISFKEMNELVPESFGEFLKFIVNKLDAKPKDIKEDACLINSVMYCIEHRCGYYDKSYVPVHNCLRNDFFNKTHHRLFIKSRTTEVGTLSLHDAYFVEEQLSFSNMRLLISAGFKMFRYAMATQHYIKIDEKTGNIVRVNDLFNTVDNDSLFSLEEIDAMDWMIYKPDMDQLYKYPPLER